MEGGSLPFQGTGTERRWIAFLFWFYIGNLFNSILRSVMWLQPHRKTTKYFENCLGKNSLWRSCKHFITPFFYMNLLFILSWLRPSPLPPSHSWSVSQFYFFPLFELLPVLHGSLYSSTPSLPCQLLATVFSRVKSVCMLWSTFLPDWSVRFLQTCLALPPVRPVPQGFPALPCFKVLWMLIRLLLSEAVSLAHNPKVTIFLLNSNLDQI